MKKEENKVDFDLSVLTLSELINLHEKVISFLQYLNENEIITEENKGED
ncbi:MAG: hypothetical protein PHF21_01605 [Bacilli bacterium]|nr:hypothetical protein [Bacilli bacterium]